MGRGLGRLRTAAFGAVGLVLTGCPLLTGCNGFFVCTKASCTTSGTTTSGDYAYVSNSSSGSTYLSEYNLTSGTLVSISTASLGFVPTALKVSPNNSFLYVASVPTATTPGIYLFSIGSTGALTAANSGTAVASDNVFSMDFSSNGDWLYTVSYNVSLGAYLLTQYSVNTSTGLVSLSETFALPGANCGLSTLTTPTTQSCTVAVSPSGGYVVVAMGTAGLELYPFTTSAGITSSTGTNLATGSTTVGDFAVALDPSNNLYLAQTSTLISYNVVSLSSLTGLTTVSHASGANPRGLALSYSDTFLYTANEGTSTLNGYTVSSGKLTAVSTVAQAGPTYVSALGADNTGKYLLAVGYDASAGIQLYTINATTGVLTLNQSTGSGTTTTVPALLALTH